MKTRSTLKHVVVVSALITLLVLSKVVVWAADVGIDAFADTYQSVLYRIRESDPFPLTRSDFESAPEALGGHRALCVTVTDGAVNASAEIMADNYNDWLVLALSPGVKAKASVQWDGVDATCTVAPTGLASTDLTGGGTNAGVGIQVVDSDGLPVNITVRIWTDGDNWAQKTVRFASLVQIATGDRVDIFIPFADFAGGAGTMNPASVRAVELELDGTIAAGADITIRLFKATSIYEYGDLPSSYGNSVLDARHIPQGLRFGANCDAEADHHASDPADGDDITGTPNVDDEDGVAPSGLPWSVGTNQGQVSVVVAGCANVGGCYVNGWLDWAGDNVLDASDQIVTDAHQTTDGTTTYTFDVPSIFTDKHYYARFRICRTANTCNSPTDSQTDVLDGEVEDYRWWLGPTGVDLASFTAAGRDRAVRLDWATANENDLLGFYLWRNTDASDPGDQLNAALIEANNAGSPFGSSYSYLDEGLAAGTTYYYWLESVEVGDVRTWHGPASAMAMFRSYLPLVLRH